MGYFNALTLRRTADPEPPTPAAPATPDRAAALLAMHFTLVLAEHIDGHTLAIYRDPKIGGPALLQPHWLVIDGQRPTRCRHYAAARGAWLAAVADWADEDDDVGFVDDFDDDFDDDDDDDDDED